MEHRAAGVLNRKPHHMLPSFISTAELIRSISTRLDRHVGAPDFFSAEHADMTISSAVLFLLGLHGGEPCLILNKRSQNVRQPGDLCCPGGGIHPRLDPFLAKLLGLPFLALGAWPSWKNWRKHHPEKARRLSIMLAAALREGFEEMRVNPLGVRFLGQLPPEHLVMFHRLIFPLVGWITHQHRFFPNGEVEKIIFIPMRALLNPDRYCRLYLRFENAPGIHAGAEEMTFPGFVHQDQKGTEYLWGATYRITIRFLETAFGFQPPPPAALPLVQGLLNQRYLQGTT